MEPKRPTSSWKAAGSRDRFGRHDRGPGGGRISFNRVSGTSAGAVIGCLVAAGLPVRSCSTALGLDYRKFRDPAPLDGCRWSAPASRCCVDDGLYRGDYTREWLP